MEKQEIKKPVQMKEENLDSLIRIMDKDIKSTKKVIAGLMRIRGISWAMSNGICKSLKINSAKRIGELTKDEIKKIEEFIKKPKLPQFLLNRRKDIDTGEDLHLTGTDLDLRRE